jgi:hypothetical protein
MRIFIEPESVQIEEKSIHPALKLKVNYEFERGILPMSFQGSVYTNSQKFIANLLELPTIDFFNNELYESEGGGFSLYNKPFENEIQRESIIQNKEFFFTVDAKTLDYLEQEREKTKNKDIIFNFFFKITFLKSGIGVGNYKTKEFNNESVIISSNPENAMRGDKNLNILIASTARSTKDYSLFNTEHKIIKIRYIIKSSDWIYDFKEKLGLGKFLIVEMNSPDFSLSSLNNMALSNEEKILKDRLEASYKIVEQMDIDLKKGEWRNVVEKTRGFQLLKDDIRQYIKKIIIETTGMNDDNVQDLTMAMDKLYHYGSALHHFKDSKGNLHLVYNGGKEDAYMVYMLITSVTNLIAKKFITFLNKKTSQVNQ